ncbi:MAG: O-antigen ligase family protein, partial [Chloroflexota bacterium]
GIASLASRVPWMSLETAGFAAAAAALFVVSAAMSRSTRTIVARGVVTAVVAWLAVLVVAWSAEALAWIVEAGWPPPAEPTRSYVWLVGNSIPVLVLLTLPVTRWLGSDALDRWLVRLLVMVGVPAVLLSGGVIGIAGVLVAIGVYLVLPLIRTRRRLLMAAGAAAVAVAAVLVVAGDLPLPSTAEARLAVWEQGARMLASDPLTGTGPGTTALVRREFVEPHAAAVLTDHLHSVPVQAAAEGGALLLAALAVAAVASARSFWRARSAQPDRGRLVISCLAGVAVTLLADSFFDIPVVVALLVTVAAWSITAERAAPGTGRTSLGGLRLAIAALAVLSVIPVVSADGARLVAASGRAEANAGDWPTALERFESAVRWNPANPLYRLLAGEAAARLGRTQLAHERFSEATAMAPGDGRAWGALAEVTSDPERRVTLLTTAAERADGDPQFALRLGRELEAAGRLAEATRAYAEAVALQPDLMATLPEADGDRVSRAAVARELPATLAALSEAARLDADAVRWDLELLLGELDADAPAAWQAVDAARDGDLRAADTRLAEALDASPTDARTWQAAAFVASVRCSAEDASRAFRLERLLLGSHALQSDERLRRWERMYREPGLGDFQPEGLAPADEPWPSPLVPASASCP